MQIKINKFHKYFWCIKGFFSTNTKLLESIQYLKVLAVCCKSLRNFTPSPKVHHELKDAWNLEEASQKQLLNIKFVKLPTRDDGEQDLFLCCGKCALCFADRIKKNCLPWGSCRLHTKSFQCCTFCVSPEEQRSLNIWEEEKIYKLCLQKGQEQELIL